VRDLGVKFDTKISFGDHIYEKDDWMHQNVLRNFKAELTGTRDESWFLNDQSRLCYSVVSLCFSVTLCTVAKWCVLEKSYY